MKSHVPVLFALLAAVAAPVSSAPPEGDAPVLACPKDAREPNAWYVGPYKGYDNNLSGLELARDAYCADLYKQLRHPNGFVTIYGSSRIGEFFEAGTPPDAAQSAQEFNRTYAEVRTFAYEWTMKYRNQYPILTGAGPGLMEAGSRGAHDAGLSIGYTTYYSPPQPGDTHGYSDDPRFWRFQHPTYGAQEITSEGLVFSSVSARETAMILHSAAIVIAPGGSGTEWEIFQILEMLKSKQLKPVPVYFIGARYHWTSLQVRIESMEARGTIKKGSLPIEFAACPADLMNKLSFRLGLTKTSPVSAVSACATQTEYLNKSITEAMTAG